MFSWVKAHIGWILGVFTLIALCVFLLYSWVDTLVSLGYARQEQKSQHEEVVILQRLLLETGKRMRRSEIEQVITKGFGKDYLIKKDEEDELSVDNVILKFEGDTLVEVKFPDQG